MNGQGLSLFQGSESIQLNTSVQQRIEEEDALEDQLRRNEELKHELQNAFDDLDDDLEYDEDAGESKTSIDIHSRLPIYEKRLQNGSHKNVQQNGYAENQFMNEILNVEGDSQVPPYGKNELENIMDEIKYLKNALNSKDEELKNISSHASAERVKYESFIDELKKRLSISEGEKERAHMSRKQTHELVVESKQKIAEQENEIAEMSVKIKTINAKNLELTSDLEHTRAMLTDIQHKYHMVERNAGTNMDKQVDVIAHQINARHAAQVDMMQQQINTMTVKLEERDNELKKITIQNNELQKLREAMLIDKSDTINQLTQKLEVAQQQCQNMISRSSAHGDLEQQNRGLWQMVTASEQQIASMQRTINNLTSRLENATAELEIMTDSAFYESSSNNKNLNTPVNDPQDLLRRRPTIGSSSTPIVVEDQLLRLKKEFSRCLADQREKCVEIQQLKDQIALKNQENEQLKKDENYALVEMNNSKEQLERLTNKLKTAESDLEALKRKSKISVQNDESNTTVQITDEEFNSVHRKLTESRCEGEKLQDMLRATQEEKDRIELSHRDLFEQNKRLIEALERGVNCTKCNNVEAEKEKFLLKDSQQECNRLKNLYINLSSEKDDLLRELAQIKNLDVYQEVDELKSTNSSLERALQLAEMKCTELKKMLDKEREDSQPHKYGENVKSFECTKDRKQSSSSCAKCIDLTTKIAQFEIENLQLQSTCSNYLKEVQDLKRSVKQSELTITELENQIVLKVEHDQLIKEMQEKAHQFEQFMRNNNHFGQKRSIESSTSPDTLRSTIHLRDQCVSTEDLNGNDMRSVSALNANSVEYRSIEKRIREEMSKIMAGKIKSSENQLKEESRRFEEQLKMISYELIETQHKLISRENDVSALKQCILSERATIRNILEQKDQDAENALAGKHELLLETQNELKAAHRRIQHLTQEFDDCGEQFSVERTSMEKLLEQWQSERAAMIMRESQLNEQVAQIQAEHEATVKYLKEKYGAAKKIAANYKKYSEDKERHIQKESERIKIAYEMAVKKIKDNMETIVKEQENKSKMKIAELRKQTELLTTNSGSNCVSSAMISGQSTCSNSI